MEIYEFDPDTLRLCPASGAGEPRHPRLESQPEGQESRWRCPGLVFAIKLSRLELTECGRLLENGP